MKKSEFHRIATIDIGTNGIKFKQYRIDVNKKSKIQQDTFSRVNIRLGEDVFNYGLISENTQKKLFKELNLSSIFFSFSFKSFDFLSTIESSSIYSDHSSLSSG